MKALKIVLLVAVSISLVITGWLYLLGVGAENTVFSLSYYKALWGNGEVIQEEYLREAVEEIEPEMDPQEEYPELNEEDVEEMIPEWESLLETIVSDALQKTVEISWLREQFLLIVEDVLELARGEKETLTVVIDTGDLRESFMENLERRINEVTEEELTEAGVPRERMDLVKPEFKERLTAAVGGTATEENEKMLDLPGKIDLGQKVQEELTPEVEKIISGVQTFHFYFPYLFYAVFALIFILSCLMAGPAGGLKWLGVSALFSGITFFSGVLLAENVILLPMLSGLVEGTPLGNETITAAVKHTASRMYTAPLVFSAAGLFLFVGGFVLGLRRKEG